MLQIFVRLGGGRNLVEGVVNWCLRGERLSYLGLLMSRESEELVKGHSGRICTQI